MKHRNNPKILLSLFVFFFINSCAHSEIERTHYYAPEDLNGDAQNTGLLLIDAVWIRGFFDATSPLGGVTISGHGKEISTGSFGTGFLGMMRGAIIIPGLTPGFYRIIRGSLKIKTAATVMNIEFPLESSMGGNAIEVKANTIVYFGQIQIRDTVFPRSREIKLEYDKGREIESWKMVSNKYNDSPWVTIIDEHIKNLE
jgi:hypothetical protein